MKIVGVIPARFASTRFSGKPLADICGKPMIWWVYHQVKKVKKFDEVYVATDSIEITDVLEKYNIPYVITKDNHPDHICRIQEVSEKVDADLYVCVNGDEPLIDPASISKVTQYALNKNKPAYYGAFRYLTDPAETIDPAKIKVLTSKDGRLIYISRTPIPYPKNSLLFQYKKYVGIECYHKETLDFFVKHPMGEIEKIEDIDHLRFIENGYPLYFTEIQSESISVDTTKDLEKVRQIIQERIDKGVLN
ncbi:MAG: 3-deoxy-manno-octulosonate cytidylyltransferase [Acetobacter sp.]|nr:3-deoxy-manno-octulosonate cytidylyltransferase [Acetobacter sp.]